MNNDSTKAFIELNDDFKEVTLFVNWIGVIDVGNMDKDLAYDEYDFVMAKIRSMFDNISDVKAELCVGTEYFDDEGGSFKSPSWQIEFKTTSIIRKGKRDFSIEKMNKFMVDTFTAVDILGAKAFGI